MKIYVQSRGKSPDFDYCWEREIPSQAIAVKALQGLSASQVDECINFGGESGFEASLPKIQE